ncbi:MAG TPA: lipoyl(octanoyl) transferase LipB [Candidatus Binataceae bacterium]|nr:lipoyl(octanoyl) transferase LipB [Candidatus Binataceae bacterium]
MNDSTRSLSVAHLGTVGYSAALALQSAMVMARHLEQIGDTLLLLEHPHVFTLGRGADERFLLPERSGEIPVYRVSRGGQVTYHGPGQLIGYPIVKLEGRDRDVHRYLRALEETMIRALGNVGIIGTRREGLTGVWVGERKIGSIGVGIKRWTTSHGFAINVRPDLSYFKGIVACGIDGCETTSIAALGKDEVTVDNFATMISSRFSEVFGYEGSIDADPVSLWNLVASNPATVEAQHRNV